MRLATLLATGLGALFLVLIALMLLTLNVDDVVAWRISSLLMVLILIAILTTIVPRAWRITRDTTGIGSTYSIAVFIPTVIVTAVTALVQLASAAGAFISNAFGVLFSGLVILLIISGTQFVRLLFMVGGGRDDQAWNPDGDS